MNSNQLKVLIKNRGLTVSQFAAQTGYSVNTVRNYLQWKKPLPTLFAAKVTANLSEVTTVTTTTTEPTKATSVTAETALTVLNYLVQLDDTTYNAILTHSKKYRNYAPTTARV